MGIVFRQSAKNSIIVVMGALLGALIIWLSTKYIPVKREYGFTQDLIFKAMTISQFLLLGLNSTMVVYIHKYSVNDPRRKLLLFFCLSIPFFLIIIFTCIYYLIPNWILRFYNVNDLLLMKQYYLLLPICTLLFIYQVILEQYLGSQLKVAVASFMREVVLRILNIITLLLLAFGYINFSIYVISMVLMYLLPVILFTILSVKSEGFGFNFQFNHFTSEEYKDLIHFSWYHFLLSISLTLMGYLDILLLPIYDKSGLNSTAVYRIAIFVIVILQLPAKAFIPASYTVLAQAFAEDNHEKANDIFMRSSINILIPTVGVAVLLCCNLSNAVAVINNDYSGIIPVFYILLIGNLINLATGMNDQVLSIAKFYKFNFYLSFILIVVLFFLLKTLIPQFGITGAAWSTTITIIIFNIAKFYYVKKKLNMQPISINTFKVFIAGIPSLLICFPYFPSPIRHVYIHSFIDAIIRSTVIIILYLLMLYWLKPSKDMVDYIASIKKNKRLF